MWKIYQGCHVQLSRLHTAQGQYVERDAANSTAIICGYTYYYNSPVDGSKVSSWNKICISW